MNDIDSIQKCCEYSDGFNVYSDNGNLVLEYPDYAISLDSMIMRDSEFRKVYYPLLIQGAIEGIEERIDLFIVTHCQPSGLYSARIDNMATAVSEYYRDDFATRIAAKIGALEYAFENWVL